MSYVSDNRHWLDTYIATFATLAGLSHWRIDLKDEWGAEIGDGDMAVWRNDTYNSADFYVHDRCERHTPDVFRSCVLHEMVHLHMRDLDEASYSLETQMGSLAWEVHKVRMHHEREQFVDNIAWAWAVWLPLPPTRKDGTIGYEPESPEAREHAGGDIWTEPQAPADVPGDDARGTFEISGPVDPVHCGL